MKKERIRFITKTLFVIGAIVLYPVLLNWILRYPLTSVIGDNVDGNRPEVIWLDFWATYSGSLLTGLIALYILFQNRKDYEKERQNACFLECKKNEYKEAKKNLEKEIERLSLYLQLYDFKQLEFVYLFCLERKFPKQISMEKLRGIYQSAMNKYSQFALHYTARQFEAIPFLIEQKRNHTLWLELLDCLQILLNIPSNDWHCREVQVKRMEDYAKYNRLNLARLTHVIYGNDWNEYSILNDVLKQYHEISQENILNQVRAYIEDRNKEVERLKV